MDIITGIILAVQAIIFFMQFKVMKSTADIAQKAAKISENAASSAERAAISSERSSSITAFITAFQYLQQEKVIQARGKLLAFYDNQQIQWREYPGSWPDELIKAAEEVCRTYDVAGMIINYNFLKPDLITVPWKHSITKCHKAAEPLLEDYRKKREPNFWINFTKLNELAQGSTNRN